MWQEGQPEILKDGELRAGAGSQEGQRALNKSWLMLCACVKCRHREHISETLVYSVVLPHFLSIK